MREQALVREAGDTEILIVPLGDQPRLRGAAALVNSPVFAAPVVAAAIAGATARARSLGRRLGRWPL